MSGLNKGGMDTFVDNLPGFPDNIRRSSSGGYWVAMSAVRPNPGFSMLDFLSQKPWIKKLIFKVDDVTRRDGIYGVILYKTNSFVHLHGS